MVLQRLQNNPRKLQKAIRTTGQITISQTPSKNSVIKGIKESQASHHQSPRLINARRVSLKRNPTHFPTTANESHRAQPVILPHTAANVTAQPRPITTLIQPETLSRPAGQTALNKKAINPVRDQQAQSDGGQSEHQGIQLFRTCVLDVCLKA